MKIPMTMRKLIDSRLVFILVLTILSTQDTAMGEPWLESGTNLTVTGSSTRVGVGVASPQSKFHVEGNDVELKIRDPRTTGGNSSIGLQSEGQLTRLKFFYNDRFAIDNAGGTEYLTIKRNGNVGIGNINPTRTLTVNGTGLFTGGLMVSDILFDNSRNAYLTGSSTPAIYGTSETGGAWPFNWNNHLVIQGRSDALRDILFVTGTSPTLRYKISGAGEHELSGAVTMTSTLGVTGNVGIGTASPVASLQISKPMNALSGTGNNYGLYLYPTSSGEIYIDALTNATSNTSMRFRVYNNTTYHDAIRISSVGGVTTSSTLGVTGNVGIGTASPGASLQISKQTNPLSGTGNNYGLYLYPTSSGEVYIDALTNATSNTSMRFRVYNNTTYHDAIRISNVGGITTSSTLGVTGLLSASGGVLVNGGSSGDGQIWKSSVSGVAMRGVAGSSYNFGLESAGGGVLLANPVNTSRVDILGGEGLRVTNNLSVSGGAGSDILYGSNFRIIDYRSINLSVGTEAWVKLATISNNSNIDFLFRNGSHNSEEVAELKILGTYHLSRTGVQFMRQTYNRHLKEVRITGTDGGSKTVYVLVRTTDYAPTISWAARVTRGSISSIHNIAETPSGGLSVAVDNSGGTLREVVGNFSYSMNSLTAGSAGSNAQNFLVNGYMEVNNTGGNSAEIELTTTGGTGSPKQWRILSLGSLQSSVGAAGSLAFRNQTDATNPMILTAAGKVGIGTAAPSAQLSVETSAGDGIAVFNPSATTSGSQAGMIGFATSTGFVNGLRAGLKAHIADYVAAGNSGMHLDFYTARMDIGDGEHRMRITSEGDIWMGEKLTVDGEATLHKAKFGPTAYGNGIYFGHKDITQVATHDYALAQFEDGTTKLNAQYGKEVAIGVGGAAMMRISSDLINLDRDVVVSGDITAETIKATGWQISEMPDYVFEKGYELASLEKVESFVKENKHLPEVPSAKKMKEEGLDLVKMNFNLLRKVEELTLYAIEQNKATRAQERRSRDLEREILELKRSLAAISKNAK